jgi:hypothetical protein
LSAASERWFKIIRGDEAEHAYDYLKGTRPETRSNEDEQLVVEERQIRYFLRRCGSSVLRSLAISLGIGEHCFTEDWEIFQADRAKLHGGFEGNKLDLGAL